MKKTLSMAIAMVLALTLISACSEASVNQGDAPSASPAVSAVSGSAIDDPEDPSNIADMDAVIEALRNPGEWVVIDVRTPEEFNGESRLPNAYGSGRIKGAINVDRASLLDSGGESISRGELESVFDFIGDKKVIVYCHGGARAAIVWSVLNDLGYDVLTYKGSWIDWSKAASVASGEPNETVLSLIEDWTDNEGEIQ